MIKLSVKVRLSRPQGAAPRDGTDILSSALLPQHVAGSGLLASIFLHIAGILFLPPFIAAGFLSSRDVHAVELDVETLTLRVPDRLYYTQPDPQPAPAAPAAGQNQNKSGISEAASGLPRRQRFRVPEIPRSEDIEQTLLQPLSPPDLKPVNPPKLPEFLLWSSLAAPPPPLRKFVAPAPARPASPTPILSSPPRLDLPNEELPLLDLRMDFAPEPDGPELPVPLSNIAPIQDIAALGQEPTDVQAALAKEGDSGLTIASLSPHPGRWSDEISIPAGNLVPKLVLSAWLDAQDGASDEGGGGSSELIEDAGKGTVGDTAAESGVAGSASGSTDTSGAAPGAGESNAGVEAAPGSGSLGGQGNEAVADASGASSSGGEAAALESANGEELVAAGAAATGGQLLTGADTSHAPGLRTVHASDGVFDFVVMQASTDDTFLLKSGVLSGTPVFTVYLPVADGIEWVMQYCLPAEAEEAGEAGTRVVTLSSPAPLVAPYPQITVVPPPGKLPSAHSVPAHGVLDAGGRLREMRILSERDPEIRELLLETFAEWKFRPATRDGVPVRIEVLVVIPPQEF